MHKHNHPDTGSGYAVCLTSKQPLYECKTDNTEQPRATFISLTSVTEMVCVMHPIFGHACTFSSTPSYEAHPGCERYRAHERLRMVASQARNAGEDTDDLHSTQQGMHGGLPPAACARADERSDFPAILSYYYAAAMTGQTHEHS